MISGLTLKPIQSYQPVLAFGTLTQFQCFVPDELNIVENLNFLKGHEENLINLLQMLPGNYSQLINRLLSTKNIEQDILQRLQQMDPVQRRQLLNTLIQSQLLFSWIHDFYQRHGCNYITDAIQSLTEQLSIASELLRNYKLNLIDNQSGNIKPGVYLDQTIISLLNPQNSCNIKIIEDIITSVNSYIYLIKQFSTQSQATQKEIKDIAPAIVLQPGSIAVDLARETENWKPTLTVPNVNPAYRFVYDICSNKIDRRNLINAIYQMWVQEIVPITGTNEEICRALTRYIETLQSNRRELE